MQSKDRAYLGQSPTGHSVSFHVPLTCPSPRALISVVLKTFCSKHWCSTKSCFPLFLSVNLSASHSVWMCVCVLLLLLFGLYSGTVLLQIESDFIGEFKRIRGQQNRPSQMATSSHLTIVLCGTCMPGKNWSQSKHNMRGHLLWKHCIRMPQPSRDYR